MSEEKPTMLTYIKETPEQLAANIERRTELTASLVKAFEEKEYKNIWVIACGSSSNASWIARPFMRKYLNMNVSIVNPATFLYEDCDPSDDTFCFVISQTGCSTNSIASLDRLKMIGKPRIGITGNVESDFKDHTDLLIDWGVGEEHVGYVTKGVATLAEYLMLFALEVAKRKGLEAEKYSEVIQELTQVPQWHRAVQDNAVSFYESHKKEMTSIAVNYVCGFEQSYGVALEGALKFGETMKIPSCAYEAEEYIHGPNLQLTPKYTVFFVDDYSKGHDRLVTIWKGTRQVTDAAYMLTADPMVDNSHALRLPVEFLKEPLISPLFQLPFFQYIAYQATEDLNRWEQHPLMKEFKKIAESKTPTISKIMND